MHVGARYYDPQVGRFTSRDTVLTEHPYLCCAHDPVNVVDPSGHWPQAPGCLPWPLGPWPGPTFGPIPLPPPKYKPIAREVVLTVCSLVGGAVVGAGGTIGGALVGAAICPTRGELVGGAIGGALGTIKGGLEGLVVGYIAWDTIDRLWPDDPKLWP